MKHDEINNPAHYQLFPGCEAIDVIKSALTPEEFAGYLKGNALKYRLRAGDKGPAEKCIAKAHWYQNRLRHELDHIAPEHGWQNMSEPYIEYDPDARTITEWPADDSRIDAIGQNGNGGEHYPEARCYHCGEVGHRPECLLVKAGE